REPADLLPRPGCDPGTEGRGEELRAETHTENRDLVPQRDLDEALLVSQMRVEVRFVDAHRPPHDDEAARAVEIGGHGLAEIDARRDRGDAGSRQRVHDHARALWGDVLEHADRTPARSRRARLFLHGGAEYQPDCRPPGRTAEERL